MSSLMALLPSIIPFSGLAHVVHLQPQASRHQNLLCPLRYLEYWHMLNMYPVHVNCSEFITAFCCMICFKGYIDCESCFPVKFISMLVIGLVVVSLTVL